VSLFLTSGELLLFPREPALALGFANRSANLTSIEHESAEIVLNETFICRSGSARVRGKSCCAAGVSMTQGVPKSERNAK
jgi:hypothetical protein